MELVYLWVEDYKNIHEQGFNFSSRFNCDYNEKTNELTIEENDDYIPDFFGKNINVTAIVGKNGSGKSSILEILQRISNVNFFTKVKENSDFKFLLLIDVASELHSKDDFYDYDKKILALTNIDELNILVDKLGSCSHRERDDLFYPLFLDSELPYNQFNKYEMASKNFQHQSDFKNFKEDYYIDLNYNSICKKIIKLKENNFSLIEFNPHKVTISHSSEILKEKFNLAQYDLRLFPRLPKEFTTKIELAIEKIKGMKNEFLFALFLSEVEEFDEDNSQELIKKIDFILNTSEEDLKLEEFIFDDMSESNKLFVEYVSLHCKEKSIKEIDFNLLEKYFDYLLIDIIDSKGRSFHSLSHGEKMIFGINLSVYYTLKTEQNDEYLFCFDEPDLSLHPNWQKEYLDLLIKTFNNFDKKIHFIFTTHSPFLLSDLPKENIIFLDKEKNGNCKVLNHDEVLSKEQTFGANIHTLLSDSFFMENGLMGEFAKGKISEIKDFYEKVVKEKKTDENIDFYNKNETKFEEIQSIIGEPFLKTVVKNYLDEIENILFEDKAKEMAIERFIKKFGEDSIKKVLK